MWCGCSMLCWPALAGVLLLAGCQSPYSVQGRLRAYPDYPDRQRSLVFAPEQLAGTQTGDLMWYDARNDAHLATSAGYASPTVESSITYTYDRQSSYRGDVTDYYHSTSYRVQYQQGSK